MCENAPDQTALVEACLNSSYCVNASGNLNVFANGMQSVTVTITNLEENSKYNASVHVQYNGSGVVYQSQPVEISKLCYNIMSNSDTIYTMHDECDTGNE